MTKPKILFALITVAALVLVMSSGFYLRMNSDTMSKAASIAWGAVFVASALTVVRGIKYLGQK